LRADIGNHRSYYRHYSSSFANAVRTVINSVVPQLASALLKAIVYPSEDHAEVKDFLLSDLVSIPDPPADVAPHFFGSSKDEENTEEDECDEDGLVLTAQYPDHTSRSTWNLRQCAASALEELSSGPLTNQAQQSLVYLVLSALENTESEWQREATLITLGTIAAAIPAGTETLRVQAHGIITVLTARLCDPEPQVREAAAWAAARCFVNIPTEFLSAPATNLALLLTNEQCKAVLEQAALAAAALAQCVDAVAPISLLAQALATATQRAISTRVRLALLEAVASLAALFQTQPVPAHFDLLMAVDACWQPHDDTILIRRKLIHPHELLPLLKASKALSNRLPQSNQDDASYYYRNAGRAATIADIAVETLEHELLESVEDARAAAQLGANAFDLAADLVGVLPADGIAHVMVSQGNDALERALHVGALNDDAELARNSGTKCTVTTLRNPRKRRSNHRPNTRRHRLALASAASLFLGELASKINHSVLINGESSAAAELIIDSAPRILACLDTPLRLASVNLTLSPTTPTSPRKQQERDFAAASLTAHNACWTLGQLFAALPLLHIADEDQVSHFIHTALDRLCSVLQSNADGVPSNLSNHAALILGSACSSLGEHLVLPHLITCLDFWLPALVVAPNEEFDTVNLVKSFRAVCAIAKKNIDLFRPSTSAALLAALASWRHCHPPTPPAELGLELKRLLRELEARGRLELAPRVISSTTPSSLQILKPGDFEYLRSLYS